VFDGMDVISFSAEQAKRAQKMFSAVVLAALDDAILEEKKNGTGVAAIAAWARSRDGRLILDSAGIEANDRTIERMQDFVRRGIRTTAA